MKHIQITLLLLILGTTTGAAAPDILQELKISRSEAESAALASLTDRTMNASRFRSALKALSPEARAALVERGLTWGRTYAESPAFAKAYATLRESRRPTPPQVEGSVDEELARRHAKLDEEMKAAEKQLQELPAEMRAEAIENFRQSVAMMKEARPQLAAMERQSIVEERKRAQSDYEARLAKWQEAFPESPRQLVAKRLREFLATSQDVDFGAETTTRNGRVLFANREYERKSPEWKLCYRAGEPAVRRARAFAEAWLQELDPKSGQ